MKLGCEEGLLPWQVEEMTWGEAALVITARQEGQRRQAQRLAIISWEQAGLTAQAALAGRLPEVYEVFPFWTEEELREIRLEKYRTIMERMAGSGQPARGQQTGCLPESEAGDRTDA